MLLLASFTRFDLLSAPTWIGLQNYLAMFQDLRISLGAAQKGLCPGHVVQQRVAGPGNLPGCLLCALIAGWKQCNCDSLEIDLRYQRFSQPGIKMDRNKIRYHLDLQTKLCAGDINYFSHLAIWLTDDHIPGRTEANPNGIHGIL